MSAAVACPEVQHLRQFLLGRLAPREAAVLEQHLVGCPSCLGKVPGLETNDSLVAAMRAPARPADPEKGVVEDLLGRVRRLQQAATKPPTVAIAGLKTAAEPDLTCGDIQAAEAVAAPSSPCVSDAPSADGALPRVPGYEILSELGRGGMGVVYKARQQSLQRLVALKMILAGAHAGPQELARFRAEAEIVARLQHPHLVQIHEIGEHEGLPYLALEYVEGSSLAKQLDGTPQNARAAAELIQSLARAMHTAHQCGVIHRDLKPANVLLATDGTPKITDFGLAKQLDKTSAQTQSGVIVGTPAYMAPEQAQARHEAISPATDLHALGVLLYELLTGRPPFRSEKPLDTLWQVIHQEPVPPTRLQPAVPRDLETICLKCLQKELHKRYASAAALADDLGRFLAGEPIQARPIGLWERAVKWARRRPTAAALVAVSLLAVLATVMGSVVYAALERELRRTTEQSSNAAGEVQKEHALGWDALDRHEWENARVAFSNALALSSADAQLDRFRAESERGLANANRGLREQEARAMVRDRQVAFRKLRDQALFHESQVTGLDLPANLEATRQAAWQALQLFAARQATPATSAPDLENWTLDLGLPGTFTDTEKAGISASCYELLLILAEAVAQPLGAEDPRTQADLALRLLDRAVVLRPAPTRAYHLRRAKYLSQRGEEPPALKELARAQLLQPEDAVDYFLLGDEAYRRKDLAQAIAYWKSALRVEPDHFWAQFLIAVGYLQMQRPDQAEIYLTACQSRQQGFVWIYIQRGLTLGQLGAEALDRGQADAAALQFAGAEADFRRAAEILEHQPNAEAAYGLAVNRGATRVQQGKHAEAVDDFQKAIQLQPHFVPAYFNLARAYQKQKQWDAALTQLNEAIRLQPKLAVLYHSRAQLALERQDLAAAQRDFEEAIRLFGNGSLSPTDRLVLAEDHTQKGILLYREKRYDDALQALETALRVRPESLLAQRCRGEVLLKLERYQAAVQTFDGYLQDTKAPTADVYEARGLARAELRDYAGAVADYSRGLELEADSSSLYLHRGRTYLVGGAPGLALADLQSALRLDPENADAYADRGYAHVKLGQYRQALVDAEDALKRAPKTSRLLYKVARILAQAVAGVDVEPARQYQERALRLMRRALELLPAEQRASFWRETIQVDPALNPIRRSDGYAQLKAIYAVAGR